MSSKVLFSSGNNTHFYKWCVLLFSADIIMPSNASCNLLRWEYIEIHPLFPHTYYYYFCREVSVMNLYFWMNSCYTAYNRDAKLSKLTKRMWM